MKHRTSLSRLMCAACALTLLCATFLLRADESLAAPAAGSFLSVSAARVALRSGASGTAGVITVLTRGATVQLLSISGKFFKVTIGRGTVGYLPSTSVRSASRRLSSATKQNVAMDWPSRFIKTNALYSYSAGMKDMEEIDRFYPNTRVVTIGASVWGNPIKALVVGSPNASTKILVQASIHAREYMTALLVMRQAENMLEAARRGAVYGSTPVSKLLSQVEIWFVPFSNPDGAQLVTKGMSAVPANAPVSAATLRFLNGGSANFKYWKANGVGVDLNRNFDGNWQVFKSAPRPAREGFSGATAFSEPESQALQALTLQQNFDLSLSYHASGEIVYWNDPYNPDLNSYDYALAQQIKLLSDYKLLSASQQVPDGGYRDWINLREGKPAFTIEVGNANCPLPVSQFSRAWLKNRNVALQMASSLLAGGPPAIVIPTPTPSETPTPEPAPSPTPEPTVEPTPAPTETPTAEPTPTPTLTETPTLTPSPTPTDTPMAEPSPTVEQPTATASTSES